MDSGSVQPLRLGVDMAGDCVGAQDMCSERIELGGRIAEEVGEGDGRKWVRVGMRGRVCQNHCHQRSQVAGKVTKTDAYSTMTLLVVGVD